MREQIMLVKFPTIENDIECAKLKKNKEINS